MNVSKRGFSLIYVVGLLSMVTITAIMVIHHIQLDQQLIGNERRQALARESASGGLMELLNDQRTTDILPTPATPDLASTYSPASDSLFSSASSRDVAQREYTGSIELVRIVPMLESSHGKVRAAVYNVEIDSTVSSGEGYGGVQAEAFKISTYSNGVVQPRKHAR